MLPARHELKASLRWLLVPAAAVAGWYLALLTGMGLLNLGLAFCPKEQNVSGMCGAAWFGPYMRAVMLIGPSIAASTIVIGCGLAAPGHRRIVSLVALAAGTGLALALSRHPTFMPAAVLSVLAGAGAAAWIWRREGGPAGSPPQVLAGYAAAFLATALVAMAVSWRTTAPYEPPFGRAPLTEKDVPRLVKAIESNEHVMEAVYGLGKIGPPAEPAVPLLVAMLDQPDEELVSGAIWALEKIGPAAKPAIPRLREFARGHDGGVYGNVRRSIKALGGIGDAEGILEAASVRDYDHEHGVADAVREYGLKAPGMAEALERLREPEESR